MKTDGPIIGPINFLNGRIRIVEFPGLSQNALGVEPFGRVPPPLEWTPECRRDNPFLIEIEEFGADLNVDLHVVFSSDYREVKVGTDVVQYRIFNALPFDFLLLFCLEWALRFQ